MSKINQYREMIKTEQDLSDIMTETFEGCYTCIRVWNAWSYNTMSIDDFYKFESGDECFEEIIYLIKRELSFKEKFNFEEFFMMLENIMSDVDLKYNSDIEGNFDSQYFNDDYFEYIDLTALYEVSCRYRDTHNPYF